jgi:hypothetical protein
LHSFRNKINPIFWVNQDGISKLELDINKRHLSTGFVMHGALPQDNGFLLDMPVSANGNFPLLEWGTQASVLNRLTKSPDQAKSVLLTSTSDGSSPSFRAVFSPSSN